MFGILQAQAPAKQTATDTIATLSSRLSTATLLEDRRAAILGLRSFAKEYPASVASGGLRELIVCLSRDAEDLETVKVVLETLLMLFTPNANSPEASDDIAFWLADEFTQQQDKIVILLDRLESTQFFPRLYSLQLLSAILSARPERTQECILAAPLGISRLVSILDDQRDAIRNEGLLLLTSLTPSSTEIQKLVAFESAFERVLNLVEQEGGLTRGGIVAQDCLSLLANLLRFNSSNQSFFRETGCIQRIAKLLAAAIKDQEESLAAEWALAQQEKNIWGLLVILRLFLVPGSIATPPNQAAFWQHGVVFLVLQLAFGHASSLSIKAEALTTIADFIKGNRPIQVGFAQLQVQSSHPDPADGKSNGETNGAVKVYVIDALLDLALNSTSTLTFDVRLAACHCLEAYFYKNAEVKSFFLKRAISVYNESPEGAMNVLSALLQPAESTRVTDPYQIWMASVIMLYLLFENHEAKTLAMAVHDGDAEKGEEVVTFIQGVAANLVSGIQRGVDDRSGVGYLMLLCVWLYEDPEAVNDFLNEGSIVQSLVQIILQPQVEQTFIQGLAAVLLGIIYEFSTKDSPIPRGTLHPILASSLGREQYISKISKLREHPILRDFDVLPQNLDPAAEGLPEVFFVKTFSDFLKDNYSRILRSIDQDPGYEASIITNGVQKGISRELVDSLRTQLEERMQLLEKAQTDLQLLETKHTQEQAEHRRTRDASALELSRLRQINDGLQKSHDDELKNLHQMSQSNMKNVEVQYRATVRDLETKVELTRREKEEVQARLTKRYDTDVQELRAKLQSAHDQAELAAKKQEARAKKNNEEFKSRRQSWELRVKQFELAATEIESAATGAERRANEAEAKVADLEKSLAEAGSYKDKVADLEKKLAAAGTASKRVTELEKDLAAAESYKGKVAELEKKLASTGKASGKVTELEKSLAESEEAKETAQTELNDLLIVMADLEEKRAKDKERLKALGEEVSDDEGGDDVDDEDE